MFADDIPVPILHHDAHAVLSVQVAFKCRLTAGNPDRRIHAVTEFLVLFPVLCVDGSGLPQDMRSIAGVGIHTRGSLRVSDAGHTCFPLCRDRVHGYVRRQHIVVRTREPGCLHSVQNAQETVDLRVRKDLRTVLIGRVQFEGLDQSRRQIVRRDIPQRLLIKELACAGACYAAVGADALNRQRPQTDRLQHLQERFVQGRSGGFRSGGINKIRIRTFQRVLRVAQPVAFAAGVQNFQCPEDRLTACRLCRRQNAVIKGEIQSIAVGHQRLAVAVIYLAAYRLYKLGARGCSVLTMPPYIVPVQFQRRQPNDINKAEQPEYNAQSIQAHDAAIAGREAHGESSFRENAGNRAISVPPAAGESAQTAEPFSCNFPLFVFFTGIQQVGIKRVAEFALFNACSRAETVRTV